MIVDGLIQFILPFPRYRSSMASSQVQLKEVTGSSVFDHQIQRSVSESVQSHSIPKVLARRWLEGLKVLKLHPLPTSI